MLSLLLLAWLAGGGLLLLAALFSLYRFLVRRRLFPQLPRVWRADRLRFVISASLFLVCLAGFTVTSMIMAPAAPVGGKTPAQDAPAAKPAEQALVASPPPGPLTGQFSGAGQPRPEGEERVLPPAAPRPEAPAAAAETPAPAAEQSAETPSETAAGDASGTLAATAPSGEARVVEEPMPTAPPPAAPEGGAAAQSLAQSLAQGGVGTTLAPSSTSTTSTETTTTTLSSTSTTQAATTTLPPKPVGRYTVFASSYQSRGPAVGQVRALRAKGLDAQVHKVDLGKKGVWYRVSVGRFASWAEADRQRRAWQKEGLVEEGAWSQALK